MSDSQILKFPSDLGRYAEQGHAHMRIEIEERVGDTTIRPYCIHTYIPLGITVGDGQTYSNLDKGIMGKGIDIVRSKMGLGGEGSTGFTKQDLVVGGAETLGRFASDVDAFFGGFTNAESARRIGLLEAGVALNPNTVVAYDAPSIRTFNFTFKFVAESAEEAETAKEIINVFRNYMYPERVGVLALQYPAKFHIKFYAGEDENLHMPIIMPCYLQNLETTYNATGNTFHRDGAPIELDMALTLTETKTLVRQDLYDNYPGLDPSEEATQEQIDAETEATEAGEETQPGG